MVVSVCSPQASATTGAALHVDGDVVRLSSDRGRCSAPQKRPASHRPHRSARPLHAGQCVLLRTIRRELKAARERTAADATPAARPVVPAHTSNSATADSDVNAAPREAVGILAAELPHKDFARVREIMTSRSVLRDPRLAEAIVSAFASVEGQPVADAPCRADLASRAVNAQDGACPFVAAVDATIRV